MQISGYLERIFIVLMQLYNVMTLEYYNLFTEYHLYACLHH